MSDCQHVISHILLLIYIIGNSLQCSLYSIFICVDACYEEFIRKAITECIYILSCLSNIEKLVLLNYTAFLLLLFGFSLLSLGFKKCPHILMYFNVNTVKSMTCCKERPRYIVC